MEKDDSYNDWIVYLQMIQNVIDRMSTTSAIFKGFCATIITGISAMSFAEINKWILLLSVSPVVCFFVLDVYYLQLEKRLRVLYKQVRNGDHEVDFDLVPPKIKEIGSNDANIKKCIMSPSIYLFYTPTVAIAIIVIVLKFMEVI